MEITIILYWFAGLLILTSVLAVYWIIDIIVDFFIKIIKEIW